MNNKKVKISKLGIKGYNENKNVVEKCGGDGDINRLM